MKAIAVSEFVLTIGVLISVGIIIFQLVTIFLAQQKISKEETVFSFSKDVNSIIDKSFSTTGSTRFVYEPIIKSYKFEIKNNTIFIFDKVSKTSVSFSKSFSMASNQFEDCEKIYFLKEKDEIAIFCKCLQNGEVCSNSLLCCSGYCNSSNKCDELPICPDDRKCVGASPSEAPRDSLGIPCCPLDKPICSEKHCCPLDKPRWCENPVNGEPRCMSEDEYATECKKLKIFKIVTVAVNYENMNAYITRAKDRLERFISVSPFRECPDSIEVTSLNLNCHCTDLDNARTCPVQVKECVENAGITDFDLIAAFNDDNICNGYAVPPFPFVICFGGLPEELDEYCISHEIGHQLKLCDEYSKSTWEDQNLNFGTFTFPYFNENLPYSGCGNPYPLNTGIGRPNECDKDCSIDNTPCISGTCGDKMSATGPPYETCIMGGGGNIEFYNPLTKTCSGMVGYPNKFDSNAYNFIKSKLKEAGYCE